MERRLKLLTVILISFFAISCSQNQLDAVPEAAKTRGFSVDAASENSAAKSTSVRVFFATDRTKTGNASPKEYFGIGRSNRVRYGVTEVSIPRDHRLGQLESPSIWRLEFEENPEKHVVLQKIQEVGKNEYFSEIKGRVAKSKESKAFVFVHGYNVTFEDAARRTAQMTYDLGFDGAPVFYSWPSQGRKRFYLKDEANIEWSERNIKQFLTDFLARSEAQNIYLIAHSMGNRGLTRAVSSLIQSNPQAKNRFKSIMLAAPDIDADVFKRDIAPHLLDAAQNVTLYVSSADRALNLSKTFHGHRRAGEAGDNVLIIDGIHTIDASQVKSSFLGHSYYAEARSIVSDIFAIIHTFKNPSERFALREIRHPNGRYWTFRK